ncbi:5944_t:CDS:2, partial [Racocetra persica]
NENFDTQSEDFQDDELQDEGFWMKKNGRDFILTAGHCAKSVTSPQFYLGNINNLIGPMVEYSVSPNDMGFIKKKLKNLFFGANILNRDPTRIGAVEYYITGSSDITSCAHRQEGVFLTSLAASYGDSGGSMYRVIDESLSLVVAVGIHIGRKITNTSLAVGVPLRKAFEA